jgi:hypothetical protein
MAVAGHKGLKKSWSLFKFKLNLFFKAIKVLATVDKKEGLLFVYDGQAYDEVINMKQDDIHVMFRHYLNNFNIKLDMTGFEEVYKNNKTKFAKEVKEHKIKKQKPKIDYEFETHIISAIPLTDEQYRDHVLQQNERLSEMMEQGEDWRVRMADMLRSRGTQEQHIVRIIDDIESGRHLKNVLDDLRKKRKKK